MAAPEFVPLPPVRPTKRYYQSPPRRPDAWIADRPGEIVGSPQPEGAQMGYQGPDQGYALKLVELFRDDLVLAEGENVDDVIAGCVAVALRRASMFGRAPTVHDLRIAFTIFGFLDGSADPALVEWRRERFEGLANHHHHYMEWRLLASSVPEETLRMAPDQAAEAYRRDWRRTIGLTGAEAAGAVSS